MTPLYQESPVMFPAEPLRFMLTIVIAVGAIVLTFLFSWMFYPGIIIALGALATLGWWWVTTNSIVVTIDEERVTHRHGILSKVHTEVELASVRTVKVDQSLVDRIFGCGLLKVITAGDKADIVQDGLPNVNKLRAALRTARGQ